MSKRGINWAGPVGCLAMLLSTALMLTVLFLVAYALGHR